MAIYSVLDPTGKERFVEAKTASQALLWAFGKDGYTAETMTTSELAAAFKTGITIENAIPEKKVA